MFKPKTEKIRKIAELSPRVIEQLESLFAGDTNVYIDDANVRPWEQKIGWHIDYKRLKQFLDSFGNIKVIKIYKGTLDGDSDSENTIDNLKKLRYEVKTKSVKIMKHFIDISSIKKSDISLLGQFIRKCLLKKYDIETVEYLNDKFGEMNARGIYYIKDRKCNFDVEIGRDILSDFEKNNPETFILWSKDSDFVDPVEQLLKSKKRVSLFATSGKVASEFQEMKEKINKEMPDLGYYENLFIFDINKIKNFICFGREIDGGSEKYSIERKGDPVKGPQAIKF